MTWETGERLTYIFKLGAVSAQCKGGFAAQLTPSPPIPKFLSHSFIAASADTSNSSWCRLSTYTPLAGLL